MARHWAIPRDSWREGSWCVAWSDGAGNATGTVREQVVASDGEPIHKTSPGTEAQIEAARMHTDRRRSAGSDSSGDACRVTSVSQEPRWHIAFERARPERI